MCPRLFQAYVADPLIVHSARAHTFEFDPLAQRSWFETYVRKLGELFVQYPEGWLPVATVDLRLSTPGSEVHWTDLYWSIVTCPGL